MSGIWDFQGVTGPFRATDVHPSWTRPGYNSTLSAWTRGTLWREPLALLRKLCQVDAVSHLAFVLPA